MKPELNDEQKAFLILEVLTWATSNDEIMAASSPQALCFDVLHCIQDNERSPVRCSNNHVFVKELKENGILWAKLLPFLENEKSDCKTKVTEPEAYGHCGHGKHTHDEETGKCTGVHTSYYVNGQYTQNPRRVPCTCTGYKTNQKW